MPAMLFFLANLDLDSDVVTFALFYTKLTKKRHVKMKGLGI